MADKRINLAVIMGGQSSEHEVSLASGINVLNALDKNKYNLKVIKIGQNGKWLVSPGFLKELPPVTQNKLESAVTLSKPASANLVLDQASHEGIDVAFIAMHGKYGEDGIIQAFLELAGIPYVGSGVLASALAMDKIKSNEIYAFHGLNVPKYIAFTQKEFPERQEEILEFLNKELGFPVVLKPSDGGSSKATFIIHSQEEFFKKAAEAFATSQNLMLQQYIKGKEVTCGVLDSDGQAVALPCTEIVPKTGEFLDLEDKYVVGGSEEIPPARITEDETAEIQKSAVTAHKVLGCEGFSRTDFIIADKIYPVRSKTPSQVSDDTPKAGRTSNGIYVLETNTIPGMTETSLFPQAAKAAGIGFSELLDKLIKQALNKK